ncbi:MAG: Qat anti-phage system QueC-like protein QatC [Phycisphaerae bacterium]|nr:Qat anti-phage system QueC-like protein QatC [Phycisphaerae bacterium]
MKFLRYVGRDGCKAKEYRDALVSKDTAVIDSLPRGGNVSLFFELNERRCKINFPDDARDLLDLGLVVYIADEMVLREAAPDGWTRDLEFMFPVATPKAWMGGAETLRKLITFLSGDITRFNFIERGRLPLVGTHRLRLRSRFDCVCLFSGGTDSLLGALALLDAKKSVLLVGHQADSVTSAAQSALAAMLHKLYPDQVFLVQSRVARSRGKKPRYALPDKVEESHRPRSLLFLSIAAAIAKTLGVTEIHIPENGLIALNPPLQTSRIGTLSTRTAHPTFLSLFAQFLVQAKLLTPRLRNPFIYDSKTDMIGAADSKLYPLLRRAVSCARPSRNNNLGVRHCGYCVPCVHRRAAFAPVGIDDANDYAHDVFKDLGSCTLHKQADFRALVRFATRVMNASVFERELIVLSQGAFSPELGGALGPRKTTTYQPWTDMLERWATSFIQLIDARCSRETNAILGRSRTRKGKATRG